MSLETFRSVLFPHPVQMLDGRSFSGSLNLFKTNTVSTRGGVGGGGDATKILSKSTSTTKRFRILDSEA